MAVKKRTTKDTPSTSQCYTYIKFSSTWRLLPCWFSTAKASNFYWLQMRFHGGEYGIMITVVYRCVTLCNLVDGYQSFRGTCYPKYGGSRFFQNASSCLPDYKASHARGFPLIFIIWVLRCNLNDAIRTEKTLTITADTSQRYRIPKLCQLGCSKLE